MVGAGLTAPSAPPPLELDEAPEPPAPPPPAAKALVGSRTATVASKKSMGFIVFLQGRCPLSERAVGWPSCEPLERYFERPSGQYARERLLSDASLHTPPDGSPTFHVGERSRQGRHKEPAPWGDMERRPCTVTGNRDRLGDEVAAALDKCPFKGASWQLCAMAHTDERDARSYISTQTSITTAEAPARSGITTTVPAYPTRRRHDCSASGALQ